MRNQPSSTNEKKKKISGEKKKSIHLHSQSPHDAEIIKKYCLGINQQHSHSTRE